MTDELKFELAMADLTPEAQARFREFVGEDWTDEMETASIWGMSKVKKTDITEDLISQVINSGKKAGVPNVEGMIHTAIERIKNGEDIAGLAMNPETGEAILLSKEEIEEMGLKEGLNVPDGHNCAECDKSDCDRHPDNPHLGSHTGPKSWN